MTLILCITLAICFGVIGWGLHYLGQHPEVLEPAPYKDYTEDTPPYLVQSFIKARWELQDQIMNASKVEMSDLYWEIERLADDYKDLIPDQLLVVHIDELFSFHATVANEISKSVVING